MKISTLNAAFVFLISLTVVANADKPNIVLIVADDLGWNAVGYHNAEFQTPNLDGLVASGMDLERFYVAPMCSPTRAGLMTGRYPIRFGLARAVIPPQRDYGLPNSETTLVEALSELGYEHRGAFGKWHLGHRRAKWHPFNQGFTHFHGHYNGAIDYFDLTREEVRDWHVDFGASSENGYATRLIAHAAANWISEKAKLDEPYFCYVPFNAPHSPFQAPEESVKKFADMKAAGNPKNRQRKKKAGAPVRQTYAAMIWEMDQGIGKILAAVKASGEEDNTIVWFLSDNGGVGSIFANNRPLRGSKLTVYEGGIRVVASLRWPKRLPAGGTSSEVCGYIDVLPTLVSVAGGDPGKICDRPLDGSNIMPILTGSGEPAEEIVAHRPWFSYHGQTGEDTEHLAVTLDGWKLKVNGPRLKSMEQLTAGTNQVELFHLSEDLNETTDLKVEQADKVQQLGKLLVEHRSLQPENGVPRYSVGKAGFVPPPNWRLDPDFPDQLVGTDRNSDSAK